MSSGKEKLVAPAVGLMTAGALNALSGVLFGLSGLLQLAKGTGGLSSEYEQTGFYFGSSGVIVCALLSVVASPIVIFGASQMLRARRYSLSRTAAVLAMVPCTSLCCVLGLPVGIWALIILNNPEAKAAFQESNETPEPAPWKPPYY
jgi:hypothetical protein